MEPMLLALDTTVARLDVSAKKPVKQEGCCLTPHRTAQSSPTQSQDNEVLGEKVDKLAEYLLGSKPPSLNAPSVC